MDMAAAAQRTVCAIPWRYSASLGITRLRIAVVDVQAPVYSRHTFATKAELVAAVDNWMRFYIINVGTHQSEITPPYHLRAHPDCHIGSKLTASTFSGEPHSTSLYQFMGKVSGKLVGTVGLFVSMSGFSTDAVDALIAGKELNLILMDGGDVRAVVRGDIDIVDAIRLKLRAAAETGTPYFAVDGTDVRRNQPAGTQHETILVEGRLDERIISTLIKWWGDRPNHQAVIPVGGPANFGPLAQALRPQLDDHVQLVVIADGGEPSVKRRINDDLASDLSRPR